MPSATRRRLLASVAAISTAGCSGQQPVGTGSSTSTKPAPPSVEPGSHLPAYAYLRSDEDARLIGLPGESTAEAGRFTSPTLVDDAATADQLVLPADAGSPSARAFVDETDFEVETLLVDQQSIEACTRLDLCHVTGGSDVLRPASLALPSL